MDEATSSIKCCSLVLKGLVTILSWTKRIRHLELVAVLVLRGWHCHKTCWPLSYGLNKSHLWAASIALLVLRAELLGIGNLIFTR